MKNSDGFIVLVTDRNNVATRITGPVHFGSAGDQVVALEGWTQVFDMAAHGKGHHIVRIAGQREGRICQCKYQPTMANVETVDHIGANIHTRRRMSRGDFYDLDSQGRRGIVMAE